ncbi:hypothetical protein J6P92_05245 [bacterium]|nr:hypothetical protein [bacterium]
MSKSVPAVTGGEIALASGLLGAGVGYILAPKKYNLKDLLTVKPDIFEKAVIKKYIINGTEKDKQAYNLIKSSREEVKKRGVSELLKSSQLENAYKSVRKYIPRARTQSAVILGVLAGVTGALVNKLSSKDKG